MGKLRTHNFVQRIFIECCIFLISIMPTGCGSKSNSANDNATEIIVDSTLSIVDDPIKEKAVSIIDETNLTTSGLTGDYSYVDLGLPSGLRWATFNVGAKSSKEKGSFFYWGEVSPKNIITENSQKSLLSYVEKKTIYPAGYGYFLTKYCTDSKYGKVDNKVTLESIDDVARCKWGDPWRLPTREEFEELIEGCVWEFKENINGNNISGCVGTSKINGNTIFFPALYKGIAYDNGDNGSYWTKSLNKENANQAYNFKFDRDEVLVKESDRWRCMGIRAVDPSFSKPISTKEKKIVTKSGQIDNHSYIDLGLKSGLKWATCNIGAEKPTEYGDYFSWGEINDKDLYDWTTYKWGTAHIYSREYNITKYCLEKEFGVVDEKHKLELEDDVATLKWKGNWRMPTYFEMEELVNGCRWKWTDNYNESRVAGIIGESKNNDGVIFFPATGRCRPTPELRGSAGFYWSSSICMKRNQCAFYLSVTPTHIIDLTFGVARVSGLCVRAVNDSDGK